MPLKATREAYAERVSEYVSALGSVGQMAAADRDLIARWARAVRSPVIDVGCGPGHWTEFIHSQGVNVIGLDAVPEFVQSARERFCGVTFQTGQAERLPASDRSLGGILAWYSLIHTAPSELPSLIQEFHRSLWPGGSLLIGYFTGRTIKPFDHAICTAYFWPQESLVALIESAGFDVLETHTRDTPGSRSHGAIIAQAHNRGPTLSSDPLPPMQQSRKPSP